jgi:hypothetical protein
LFLLRRRRRCRTTVGTIGNHHFELDLNKSKATIRTLILHVWNRWLLPFGDEVNRNAFLDWDLGIGVWGKSRERLGTIIESKCESAFNLTE